MTFLIIPELEEMLNKAQLFSKTAEQTGTWLHKAYYTDLKATLKALIAVERGVEDERKIAQNA